MPTPRRSQDDKLKAFRKVCKQLGLKLTHQRLQILDVVASARHHPSAEEVFERVRTGMPTVSFDTVYRTLALFERHGLVARVSHLDDRTRYDPNLGPHYHLVCTQCRRIWDFDWPALGQLEAPHDTEGWGRIEGRYLELRGICQQCLRKQEEGFTV